MGEVSTIGLDIAKSVFQIHGVDVDGAVVIRKRITRAKLLEFFVALPSCLVGPRSYTWRAYTPQTAAPFAAAFRALLRFFPTRTVRQPRAAVALDNQNLWNWNH